MASSQGSRPGPGTSPAAPGTSPAAPEDSPAPGSAACLRVLLEGMLAAAEEHVSRHGEGQRQQHHHQQGQEQREHHDEGQQRNTPHPHTAANTRGAKKAKVSPGPPAKGDAAQAPAAAPFPGPVSNPAASAAARQLVSGLLFHLPSRHYDGRLLQQLAAEYGLQVRLSNVES